MNRCRLQSEAFEGCIIIGRRIGPSLAMLLVIKCRTLDRRFGSPKIGPLWDIFRTFRMPYNCREVNAVFRGNASPSFGEAKVRVVTHHLI